MSSPKTTTTNRTDAQTDAQTDARKRLTAEAEHAAAFAIGDVSDLIILARRISAPAAAVKALLKARRQLKRAAVTIGAE